MTDIAKMKDRLATLEAIEAIRNLIASYGPAADTGDAKAVAGLWTDNGEYDVGGYGIAEGADAIAALITGDTHQQLMAEGCAHILSPHRIDLEGDQATATGYSIVYRRTGDGYVPWRVSANHWEFKRQTDGEWRVTRRVNRPVGPRPQ